MEILCVGVSWSSTSRPNSCFFHAAFEQLLNLPTSFWKLGSRSSKPFRTLLPLHNKSSAPWVWGWGQKIKWAHRRKHWTCPSIQQPIIPGEPFKTPITLWNYIWEEWKQGFHLNWRSQAECIYLLKTSIDSKKSQEKEIDMGEVFHDQSSSRGNWSLAFWLPTQNRESIKRSESLKLHVQSLHGPER